MGERNHSTDTTSVTGHLQWATHFPRGCVMMYYPGFVCFAYGQTTPLLLDVTYSLCSHPVTLKFVGSCHHFIVTVIWSLHDVNSHPWKKKNCSIFFISCHSHIDLYMYVSMYCMLDLKAFTLSFSQWEAATAESLCHFVSNFGRAQ